MTRIIVIFLLFFSGFDPSFAKTAELPIIEYDQTFHPVIAKGGMVATQEALATEVGVDILKAGGNAVDAAVAVGFALAVTLPRAGNLGGGGFMLVYLADQKKTIAIDYREMAPLSATTKMFLDKQGEVDKALARSSYLASGVPGTPKGLVHALKSYGTMSLKQVLKPAIALAEKGIKVSYDLASSLQSRASRLRESPAAAKVFFKGDAYFEPGETLIQSDLAWSLNEIAQNGDKAFYQGEIAKKIVAEMKTNNGLITAKDLLAYQVIEREPVQGSFYGHKIVSMPPPSSGGIHLIQMLNMLELLDIKKHPLNSAQYYHTLVEVMKRAYADRSKHLGDPDFYQIPAKGLLSRAYAKSLIQDIKSNKAKPSAEIAPGKPSAYESNETTHYSVVDRWGNAVANTYTLNFSYGNGKMIPGTGILMNNEMDDFSAKPGEANAFGLLGGQANAIAAKKRPLSSMTPTFVFKGDGPPLLVTGSPGGSTIITIVLQQVLNTVLAEMNVATATAAPRIHHQWFPDKIFVEPAISEDTLTILKSFGHEVHRSRTLGSVQAISYKAGFLYGFSDPRRPGALTLGLELPAQRQK